MRSEQKAKDPGQLMADWLEHAVQLYQLPWRLAATTVESWSSASEPGYLRRSGVDVKGPSYDRVRVDLKRHGQRDRDCSCASCECRICDADVIVYARAGEMRVVPLVIDNPRCNPVDVTLRLGDFSLSGVSAGDGVLPIEGKVEPGQLRIDACGSAEARLLVKVGDRQAKRDVSGCDVFTALLTLEGCRTRPLVIAVAVLDMDCDPIHLECLSHCC